MALKEFPFYPWYPKDYAGDALVRAMTKDQDLTYRRLLDQSWELGGLPSEPYKLAMLAGYTPEEFKEVWTYPLTDCWVENGDGELVNKRLEFQRGVVQKKSIAGAKAANARWKAERKLLRGKKKSKHAVALKPHSERNAIKREMETEIEMKKKRKRRAASPPSLPGIAAAAHAAQGRKPRKKKEPEVWWSQERMKFEGNLDSIKQKVRTRYEGEFGTRWINATWHSILEWSEDNPEKIKEKKDHGLFILNWFGRDAKTKREGGKND